MNTKGFTLIELVVVIVILGILSAVAAFSYKQFVDNAKEKTLKAEFSQAAKTYYGVKASGKSAAESLEIAYEDAQRAGFTVATGTNSDVERLVAVDLDEMVLAMSYTGICFTWTPAPNSSAGYPDLLPGSAKAVAAPGATCS